MTSFFFNNHWCKNPTVNSHDWYSNKWIIFTQLVFYTKFCTNLDTKHQISWYDQFYWIMTILLPTKNTPVLIQVPGAPEKFVQSFSIRGVFVGGGLACVKRIHHHSQSLNHITNVSCLVCLFFTTNMTSESMLHKPNLVKRLRKIRWNSHAPVHSSHGDFFWKIIHFKI